MSRRLGTGILLVSLLWALKLAYLRTRSPFFGPLFSPGTGIEALFMAAGAALPVVAQIRTRRRYQKADSMYTMIEGEWDEVMDVVKRATEAVAAKAPRVQLVLKADIWPDIQHPLDGKIAVLEQRIADTA
ncbi:thiamine-binding protein [Streptomyces gilvosporeus]|uniref:thiamine-binding protein n=1 Tax=Streptomyces gilvosporeus TaxID=553510 RepID=UPI001F22F78F|nr:thiamine-binding protein [Streptomyces gilvosporeus]